MHAFMSARPSRHSDAALRLLRDAEVSDLPPHEIAAAVVLALMIIVINVGLLVWVIQGYEPTREAAMAAFAKSWRRE
jgi:hypothetical protein